MSSRTVSNNKKPVSNERITRVSRRNSTTTNLAETPALGFSPSIPSLVETEEELSLPASSNQEDPSPLPTPSTLIVSLPDSPRLSTFSDSDSDDMPTNTNGKETIDMGSSKNGCTLLIASPTLETLEELWDYVLMNLDLRKITDDMTKKVEFTRCFIKWAHLRAQISELGPELYKKEWIIPLPDHPDIPGEFLERPFYDAIRDALLGADWARQYDATRENAHMRANARGFSSFATWMESHNRRLRGTQYHKTDDGLKVLIIQKLTKEFRDDLRDCQVSEALPYVEWKKKCKEVEERRPPGPAVNYNVEKPRNDNRVKKSDSSGVSYPSSSSGDSPEPIQIPQSFYRPTKPSDGGQSLLPML